MNKEVFSLCFMCSIRCPIRVLAKDGQVEWIEGNPHVPGMEGSLCPRGAAGISLLYDSERVQTPLIRVGERGSGNWRKTTWDEALDFVAGKLKDIMEKHGPQSIVFGERTQLATHVSKTFVKALGSPNHFTHDALCKGSVNTACRSLFGYTDAQMAMDYKNTRHIVLYGRNIFEAVSVKEVNNLMDALENGAKMTYIDPRVTVTATKAHRYWMIRPGTDLALNYALIHVILNERLYDADFADQWISGISELREFVSGYTPQWAEKETGIPAGDIIAFAREISRDKPSVIFHFGYRGANHVNEIYMRRSILILNCLMGAIEVKGGLFFKKGPGEVGGKPARKLTEQKFDAKIDGPRFDKVGTKDFPLPDANHGVPQILPHAILNADPYPIKALIAYRFEPLMSIPDTGHTRKALDKLDLIVTIDVNYSDIAWYSDVILPESIYLERTDCVQQADGLKPQIFLRKQAVAPRYDTREGAMILKQLGEKLGIGRYFPYETMEDLVRWQLEGTGFALEDFEKKGFVAYCKDPVFWDRDKLKFKTPSGKIELVSSLLENAGFASFPAYEPVPAPLPGMFRLTTGRCALHTHVSTQNNLYLNEFLPENVVWINAKKAAELGIANNDMVEISSNAGTGTIRAYVSDLIHPEAVFLLHGFGHQAKWASRSCGRGVSDSLLQENISDMVGGSPAFHETFVNIKAA
jgi:thiosulfate reductase/polysulfide reductase chain A